MSVIEDRLHYLEALRLGQGSHTAPNNGLVEACVMEAVSYVAGEPWSDHPLCASKILTSFLVRWNDRLDDDSRQILKPFIPRLVGTNTGPEDEETRRYMLLDWLAHEAMPGLLRQAGLTEHAEALEELVAVTDGETARAARVVMREAGDAARAKRRIWRTELRKRVKDELAKRAVAVAAAVADAVAVAVAAADAAAAADADAVAVAVAAADAVAVAAAAADADAVAAAAADADADAKTYWERYYAAKAAAYAVLKPVYDEKLGELNAGLRESALGVLDRMIEVGKK